VGANEPRWVDTVPFGCWRRDTFERVGLFDESLPRNQDDEFNMRIRAAGGRILLLPEVRTRYYARRTLGQLWRMFSQYGYYKPLTAIRARSRLRPRQFAPAVLVLALVTGVALLPFSVWPLLICTTTYVLFVLGAAIPIAVTSGPSVGVAFAAALVVMHGGYGIGFLRGVVQFAILRRHEPAPAASLSR
jgi:hypothetical protein